MYKDSSISVYESPPTVFQLGPLQKMRAFLLVPSAPIYLMVGDFLELYNTQTSFSQKVEMYLELEMK